MVPVAVKTVPDYYPFGGVIADRGFGRAVQPHKTAGKELDMMHGLGWADFGARRYDPVLPQWTQPDPLAEKYYHLSPYSYCGLNPANNIDPDGQDWVSAQYEDDYFFFWHEDIRNQQDINRMFPNNEGIKYLGKEYEFYMSDESGISVYSLLEDGSFEINCDIQTTEYDKANLHIGSANFTDMNSSGNIKKGFESNWYGMYLGPKNPKLKNGTDSYAVPPVSKLDYAAYLHDKAYDVTGAKGITGALFNNNVAKADAKLAERAKSYIHSSNNTANGMKWANRVQILFFNLSNFKSNFKTYK